MSVLKIKDTQGNWNSIQTIKGNGISSISKTSTSGLVDTYTITFTEGNTTTFNVTNGADGEITTAQMNAAIAAALTPYRTSSAQDAIDATKQGLVDLSIVDGKLCVTYEEE